MKEKIELYKTQLKEVKENIQNDLQQYLNNNFKRNDFNFDNPDIQILNLKTEKDINDIYYGQGFYIILTGHTLEGNKCHFKFDNKTAIYRGHSYYVKKRIFSHLANSKHKSLHKPNYTVCLKIDDKVNGIDIDNDRFKDWGWTVIIIKMKGSSSIIREQMEIAFDNEFQRPCKSRESIPNMKMEIKELNKSLNSLADRLRQNKIVEPKEIDQLLLQSKNISNVILDFDDELTKDKTVFLNFSETDLNGINKLEQKDKALKSDLHSSIAKSDFEEAAHIRDKRAVIRLGIKNKIIDLNKFSQGFNIFNDKLLIVKPTDSFRSHILESLFHRKK